MKTYLSLILIFLSSTLAIAQKPLKRTELSQDFFLTKVETGGQQLLTKYKGVTLAYNKVRKELLMYGEIDDQYIIFLEKIAFTGRFYPDRFKGCTFADGKVSLCSQVPDRATVICNIFTWEKETMKFEKEESYDLSQIQTERAAGLVKSGKVNEALLTYDSVQYSDSYYDAVKTGVELLQAAAPAASEMAGRRRFKEAADLIKRVLAFKGWKFLQETKTEADLKARFGKSLHGMTYAQLEKIIEDYCRYLAEGRMYDDAIALIGTHRKFFPSNTNMMLYLGDAWYGKKDKQKASDSYKAYVAKMKEQKREKDVPYTVQQRIID